MMFIQTAHLTLNDVGDALGNHDGIFTTIRRAVAVNRNGLSYAKHNRYSDMKEELFWKTLKSLKSQTSEFGMSRKYCGYPKRFKRIINVVDPTTIRLIANRLHGLG